MGRELTSVTYRHCWAQPDDLQPGVLRHAFWDTCQNGGEGPDPGHNPTNTYSHSRAARHGSPVS
jgi:hypothetical protein